MTPPPGPMLAARDAARSVLRQVIAYCDDRWLELAQAPSDGAFQTAAVAGARQAAYADVMRYANTLLAEHPADDRRREP